MKLYISLELFPSFLIAKSESKLKFESHFQNHSVQQGAIVILCTLLHGISSKFAASNMFVS